MGILSALVILLILAAICGMLLGFFAQKFKVEQNPIAEQIDAILPQTQCGQCNFPGCKPYAQAIADGKADINQCPPGGQEGVDKIAEILGVETKPLNAEHGEESEAEVAFIIEDWCIGCTKCIQACPVDAIIGANKRMHTIISDECTGCRLCVEPCPVDCIIMKPREQAWQWDKPQPPNLKP
ncbi:MAG: electron transport complex subunit RsxB [Cardiobacteriaceae bacterium]|nr:electron transport complex subunit RsxB [Cardiobacteriaceae bacterium]